jgi:hypothetical protein
MADRNESHQIEVTNNLMGKPVDHIQRHHLRSIRKKV